MGAFSFATGFFDKLNADRDRNEENDLKMQSNLMNIWASTTLPMIQKHRAEDEESVARMNDYIQLEPFQKNPEMAYIAARAVGRKEAADANDWLDKYQKNPDEMVPPEVRQKQLDSLARTFSYDINDGKVGNFRLKPQGDNSAPLPGANKENSIWGAFTGKKANIDTANDARSKFMGMTGQDPTDPLAGGGRFGNASTSGTLNIKPIDRKAEKFQEAAANAVLSNLNTARDISGLLTASQGGPEALLKYASRKDAFYGKKELDAMASSRAFQEGMSMAITKAVMDGDFKDPTGAIRMVADGKLNGASLSKLIQDNLKTPEEKAQFSLEQLRKKGAITPSGAADLLSIISQKDLLDIAVPNEKDQPRFVANVMNFVQQQLMSQNMRFMNGVNPEMFKQGDNGFSSVIQPAAEPEKPKNNPWGEGEAVEGAIGYVEPEKPKISFDRLGENKETGEIEHTTTPITTAILDVDKGVEGASDAISGANPFAVVKTVSVLKSKNLLKDPSKVVQAIRFRPYDVNRLKNAQFAQNSDIEAMAPYMKKYESEAAAAKDAPVGSLVMIRNQFVIVPPEWKNKYKQ